MNLINSISRKFTLVSMLLLIWIYLGLYFFIDYSVRKEADEQLVHITQKVINEIKVGGVTDYSPFIEIEELDVHFSKLSKEKKLIYEDVSIDFDDSDKDEPYRELNKIEQINGKVYRITTRISMEEKNYLINILSIVILSSIIIYLIVMSTVNKFISKSVLKDFFEIMKEISKFSLTEKKPLILSSSSIVEFDKLKNTLIYLSEKALKEYQTLHEFTEELNHEIHTPISVMKAKLELLLQNDNLLEENYAQVESLLKNLAKLEKLSKSLLILNKLENIEAYNSHIININEEINQILMFYYELIEQKNIFVKIYEKPTNEFKFISNKQLIYNLFNNLISNAIKHNYKGGKILIIVSNDLSRQQIIISNTSKQPRSNPNDFFKRFYKESNLQDSVGLGLTIVKKICEIYHIQINASYRNGYFRIRLIFPTK